MNSSNEEWLPGGRLTPAQQQALAVFGPKPEDEEMLRESWGEKLQELINQDQKAARQLMEMSVENAPELLTIAAQNQPSQWGMQIAHSDSALSLFNRIDWEQPGTLQPSPPESQNLRAILEQLP